MNLVVFGGVLGYGGMEAAWKDSRLSPSSVSISQHQPSSANRQENVFHQGSLII
jgi:hypothetical protein